MIKQKRMVVVVMASLMVVGGVAWFISGDGSLRRASERDSVISQTRLAASENVPLIVADSESKEGEEECLPCAKKATEGQALEEHHETSVTAPKPFFKISLTPAEVESFLKKRQRDGASLIAAFTALGDLRYLREAVDRAPELPEVALAALAVGGFGADADWIQRLRDADPDNALVHFLGALEAFRRQDGKEALGALQLAQTLPELDDYRGSRMRLIEEAALDAGYSSEKASALAAKSSDPTDALLPKYLELAELVSSHLSNYRNRTEEVDWILQSALKLGAELQKEGAGRSLFMQAGAALYRKELYEGVSESSPFPSLQDSAASLVAGAQQEKERMVQLWQAFQSAGWLQQRNELAVLEFFLKKREVGERAALVWALAN